MHEENRYSNFLTVEYKLYFIALMVAEVLQ